jgi:hypothetical protein
MAIAKCVKDKVWVIEHILSLGGIAKSRNALLEN